MDKFSLNFIIIVFLLSVVDAGIFSYFFPGISMNDLYCFSATSAVFSFGFSCIIEVRAKRSRTGKYSLDDVFGSFDYWLAFVVVTIFLGLFCFFTNDLWEFFATNVIISSSSIVLSFMFDKRSLLE